MTLFIISLQFRAILLSTKLCYWEENTSKQVENPYVLTVFSAVTSLLPHILHTYLTFFSIFFAEPPKSFAIIQNNEAKESSTDITVVDGKLETIHCESRKSNPPPVLQWFLGDKQLRASVQVNIYESEL